MAGIDDIKNQALDHIEDFKVIQYANQSLLERILHAVSDKPQELKGLNVQSQANILKVQVTGALWPNKTPQELFTVPLGSYYRLDHWGFMEINGANEVPFLLIDDSLSPVAVPDASGIPKPFGSNSPALLIPPGRKLLAMTTVSNTTLVNFVLFYTIFKLGL
jgi:hypothetical protein